jgi:AAA ATPase domain/Trypsin-like peptidase domain
MAIVRPSDRIAAVDAFVGGLRRAGRSVVRIAGPEGMNRASGWFITPSIVVLPGFAMTQAGRLPDPELPVRVQLFKRRRMHWEATIAHRPELLGVGLMPMAPDVPALALLRVPDAPPAARPLPLALDPPVAGQAVSLLHFPQDHQEACVSFGRLLVAAGRLLEYDVNTLPGSSGGPLFAEDWRVIGIHLGTDRTRNANLGAATGRMLDVLRGSPLWPEIADYHQIADVKAARNRISQAIQATRQASVPPVLLRAAVHRTIDPGQLSDDERKELAPHVVSQNATQWILRPGMREEIVRRAGSLDALREARGSLPPADTGQRVIDRILAGPPYDLSDASDEELSWWIQGSRWFASTVKGLPTPSDITRLLERRRIQSRLSQIAGPQFRGRSAELARIQQWLDTQKGPLVISGVGGIGKSALVAKFISELSSPGTLLWLDFDRADLAPDDAVSVLTAIAEQAALQIDGFEAPPLTEENWESAARLLGERLQPGKQPLILVLDSFEAAQYAERYHELWPVLEGIAGVAPALRLIVTGRAPVPDLRLRGEPAEHHVIEGLSAEDARAWLVDAGITDEAVLRRVLELAGGVPLVLKLALMLVESGGRLEDLPQALPQEIVAGYLYDRILDRMQNPAFKPIARAILVLRRFTADMAEPILGGLVTLPPGETSKWFSELSHEIALVEGGPVLRLRPEVRAATLKLLLHEDAEFVREIDSRAERWYEARLAQAPADAEIGAELVYHRLRLGDLTGAESAWRTEYIPHLKEAHEDLDPPARDWLAARTEPGAALSYAFAEERTVEQVKSLRSRGRHRAAARVLTSSAPPAGAQAPQSDGGALVFQRAYQLWAAHENDDAHRLMEGAGEATGEVQRDRQVLRARLAAEAGHRHEADAALEGLDDPERWKTESNGQLCALAVRAARIRLATDIQGELDLLRGLKGPATTVFRTLSSMDVVLPVLQQRLVSQRPVLEESSEPLPLDRDGTDWHAPLARVEAERAATLPNESPEIRPERDRLLAAWAEGIDWSRAQVDRKGPRARTLAGRALTLAECGWRRWFLAFHRRFLAEAYRLCVEGTASGDLTLSVLGTTALFARQFGRLRLTGAQGDLVQVLSHGPAIRTLASPTPPQWKLAEELGLEPQKWASPGGTAQQAITFTGSMWDQWIEAGGAPRANVGALLLALLAPDPLVQLVHHLAGRSEAK